MLAIVGDFVYNYWKLPKEELHRFYTPEYLQVLGSKTAYVKKIVKSLLWLQRELHKI